MGCCVGGGAPARFFCFCWYRKTVPRMIRAMRATPPMTPPTMAPTGVGEAGASDGSVEDVGARLVSVADADVEDSVLEGAVSVDDEDSEDDVDVSGEDVSEDDVLEVVRWVDVEGVEVVGSMTCVDMDRLLSPLCVVSASCTLRALRVAQ